MSVRIGGRCCWRRERNKRSVVALGRSRRANYLVVSQLGQSVGRATNTQTGASIFAAAAAALVRHRRRALFAPGRWTLFAGVINGARAYTEIRFTFAYYCSQ